MIPQEYIQEVVRRNDIEEVIGQYVQLRRRGRTATGLCPFHNEKTPSFVVYPDTQSFYCFGCGAAGDVINFVRKYNNLGYVEAVKQLAGRAGMPLPEEDDRESRARQRLLEINRCAARYFYENLNAKTPEAAMARRYWKEKRGLSDAAIRRFGLGYAPEIFYSTDGLIRALAPLHRSGVPICVHMRQEGDGVVDALREMLEVARALQTPLEVSHLKAIGGRNARKTVPEMLSLIERARQDGLDVMCDVYPYTAGSTQLIHVLPPEFQEGGTEALTKRLLDDAARKEMRARMEAGSDFENITLLVGFDNVIAIGLQMDEYRRFEGKSVAEIAQTLQKDPFDALFDLLAAEQCNTGMIDYISDEEDVKDILRTPFSGVISDATYPSGGRVHPRVYGTFARLIEKYVVQERVLTLEQAVHKVTGHAADRFGFEKKGVIAAGMDADLLLFSPENVREHGTYARPNLPATGFDEVFVLGERVIENGVYRGGSSGEMLVARMGY